MPGYYEGDETVERTFDIDDKSIEEIIFGYNFFNYLIDFAHPPHSRRISFIDDKDKNYKMDVLKHAQWILKKNIIVVEGINSFNLRKREIEINIINNYDIDLIFK